MRIRAIPVIILVLFIFASPSSYADDPEEEVDQSDELPREIDDAPSPSKVDYKYNSIFFGGGMIRYNTKGINGYLERYGYPDIEESLTTFSIINDYREGRGAGFFKLEFQWDSKGSNEYYNTNFSGFSFLWDFGMDIPAGERWRFNPYMGLGFGVMTLRIDEKDTSSTDESIGDRGRLTSINARSFLTDIGLALKYFVHLSGEPGDQKRECIAFQVIAGYLYSPIRTDWYVFTENLSGGPNFNMSGPYVSAFIGFGDGKPN